MRAEPTCPRCVGPLRAPSVWSSDWTCPVHGAVLPRQPSKRPGAESLAAVLSDTRVPVWTPWPLPHGWLITGFGTAGDERTGVRGCAVALSGPNLLGGPADMLLIAEEPGVGLGAHHAGLDGPDPGAGFDSVPPQVKVDISGPRATPGGTVSMWSVQAAPDRAVYVGEAMGNWLWAVLWPATAGVLMLEPQTLLDLREPGMEPHLPYGAHCGRLDE